MLSRQLQHAWHWSITQIVEHSLAASHDGFANSYWNVWQCGRGDTHATTQEVRLKGIRLVCVCCSSVSVSSVYCQINWISLAVVGGCTALFMVGAILAYDPSRGFLARRGEPGGGTYEMLVPRRGRRHGTGLARHIARRRPALSRLAVQPDQGAGNLRCRRVDRAVHRRRRERVGGGRHDKGLGRAACGAPHAARS